MQEKIIILDFGSQYTQLIARRLRELNTYCEILPYNKFPYGEEGIKGVILSGSPYSVNDPNALFVDLSRIRGAIGRHNNNQLVFETFNWQSRSTQMHTHCFIVTGASSTRASSSRTCWKNRECGKACLVLADALTMVRWRASGAS